MEQTGKQFRKRTAILTCLRQSKAHPSAEDIYHSLQQEHSDISLASVYRNIKLFKDEGLIISLGTVNGVERLDGCVEPHVHFACSSCGAGCARGCGAPQHCPVNRGFPPLPGG